MLERFAHWMTRALHDPRSGYYATQIRGVGRRGDFSTAASTGEVLGVAIAQWIRHELAHHAGVRTIIEVGGGDGSLSAAVRRTLGWWKCRGLRWLMVETSTPLRVQQESKPGTRRVQWYGDMADALRACGGSAVIFHNELVDAFPVSVFQWDALHAEWREIWVTNEGGDWHEVLQPAGMAMADSISLSPSAWKPLALRDGQRIEVAGACGDWLRGWAPHWKRGSMLTIDYGDVFPALYHRQPQGTVRAYFMQQRLTGAQVYENMGRQDLTADVNFSDLVAWGEALGWSTAQLTTQREFIFQHVPGLEAQSRMDAATSFLTDEHGAGGAFKVLIQRQG